MKREFEFDLIDNNFGILYSTEAWEILKNYHCTFNLACCLIKEVTGIEKFNVSLKESNEDNIYTFSLKSKKSDMFLTILDNTIIINTGNTIYNFNINWARHMGYAKLNQITYNLPNGIFRQTFKIHNVILEWFFLNKKFYLETPYDMDYVFDDSIFNKLKESATINDLKKFYLEYFFRYQKDYEKKFETYLNVEANEADIKDKLILIDGFVKYYYLSEQTKGVILSIEGTDTKKGKIIIKNYQGEELDLNTKLND